MCPIMENASDAGILMLEGAFTIERANELKQLLVNALKDKNRVALNLEGITEVDLSCLQLLCSAHRTSMELKKRLTVEGRQPEVFQRAVKDAGFTRPVGCHKDPDKSCLWLGGLE